MTTNKELIRQLAEEMTRAFMKAPKDRFIPESVFLYHKECAEIAVKFGEKMFEEGFYCATEIPDNIVYSYAIKLGKKERGLIAEKEGEDEKGE